MNHRSPVCGNAEGMPEDVRMMRVPVMPQPEPKAAPEAADWFPWTLEDIRTELERVDHLLRLAVMAMAKLSIDRKNDPIVCSDVAMIDTAIDKARADLEDVLNVLEKAPPEVVAARFTDLVRRPASRVQA